MGAASQKPPPNFAVAPNGTVTFNTAGLALGLWTAQVRIFDGISYSVVDFLIDNIVCSKMYFLYVGLILIYIAGETKIV